MKSPQKGREGQPHRTRRRSRFTPQRFGDIDFGEDDANIEYEISNHKKASPIFVRAFYDHPQIHLDDFRTGRKYLILGQKGTGKTAILRKLQQDFHNSGEKTHFMIFRDEVASQEELTRFGKIFSVSVNDVKNIYHHFYTLERLLLLSLSSSIENIGDAAKRIDESNHNSADTRTRVLPIIQRVFGKPLKDVVQVGLETISEVVRTINVDPEKFTGGGITVDNNILLRKTNEKLYDACVAALVQQKRPVYLFVDEIHFTYRLGQDHDQDAGLVRDLIRAVAKLNRNFRDSNVKCFVYAAVRSEYLDHPLISAAELHPVLSAFGTEISWATFGANFNHPMFEIGARRVDAQTLRGLTGKQFMTACFANFKDSDAADFVRSTWSKPRDMVRFLRTCKEMFPERTTLSISEYQQAFHKSCISARKEVETALTSFLTYSGVEKTMTLLSNNSSVSMEKGNIGTIDNFRKKLEPIVDKETQQGSLHDPDALFKLLYMLGAIYTMRPVPAQTLPIMHSYHRGNPNPDPDGFVAIHKAVAKSFS